MDEYKSFKKNYPKILLEKSKYLYDNLNEIITNKLLKADES